MPKDPWYADPFEYKIIKDYSKPLKEYADSLEKIKEHNDKIKKELIAAELDVGWPEEKEDEDGLWYSDAKPIGKFESYTYVPEHIGGPPIQKEIKPRVIHYIGSVSGTYCKACGAPNNGHDNGGFWVVMKSTWSIPDVNFVRCTIGKVWNHKYDSILFINSPASHIETISIRNECITLLQLSSPRSEVSLAAIEFLQLTETKGFEIYSALAQLKSKIIELLKRSTKEEVKPPLRKILKAIYVFP